jgi:glycosyltransferase involved in cell wall biosynthesis
MSDVAPFAGQVSFVVPAYNEEKALPDALAAIHAAMAAIGRPYEIVVADDASTDATASIAAAAGARVVAVDFRQIARTRNAGAAAATGDPIVFVDADTCVNETVLARAFEAMEAGAVGGGATPRFDAAAPGWSRMAMWMVIGPMRLLNLAAGCFVFVRRGPFEAVGGFDERHFAGEEVMLSWAMKRLGRFVVLPDRVDTSARKFVGTSPWKTLWLSLRLAFRGMRGIRRREGNDFWYDGRR